MTDVFDSASTDEKDGRSSSVAGFPSASGRERGYDRAAVDEFLSRARAAFERSPSDEGETLTAADVRAAGFPLVRRGYRVSAVDAALGRIEDAFAVRERDEAMSRSGARAWVDRARDEAQVLLDRFSRPAGKRFARTGWLSFGYRVDEVDLVSDKLAAYFSSGAPASVEQVRAVAFRMQRRGYREEQVDAVLDAVVDVMLAVR